jgi:chromosome segregation ATPase
VTDSEITTTILRQIRDEIVRSNSRLDTLTEQAVITNERLDALTAHAERTNERLDSVNERLTVVETVLRDATTQVVFLGRYVKNKQDAAIADLRKRVGKLEKKVG